MKCSGYCENVKKPFQEWARFQKQGMFEGVQEYVIQVLPRQVMTNIFD